MDASTVTLLQPIEEGLVSLAAVALTAGASLLTVWAQQHFTLANTAAAKSMEASANAVLQSATQNAAGDVIAGIKSGAIDLNDAAGLRRAAMSAALTIETKVPEAVALLRPSITVLADMALQKAHLAMAPTIVSVL